MTCGDSTGGDDEVELIGDEERDDDVDDECEIDEACAASGR